MFRSRALGPPLHRPCRRRSPKSAPAQSSYHEAGAIGRRASRRRSRGLLAATFPGENGGGGDREAHGTVLGGRGSGLTGGRPISAGRRGYVHPEFQGPSTLQHHLGSSSSSSILQDAGRPADVVRPEVALSDEGSWERGYPSRPGERHVPLLHPHHHPATGVSRPPGKAEPSRPPGPPARRPPPPL